MPRVWDIRSELSARGFVFNRTDGSWVHQSGAVMAEEAIDDLQRVHGSIVVEKLLLAIDAGAIDWAINHVPDSTNPFDASWKVVVHRRTILDKLAKL